MTTAYRHSNAPDVPSDPHYLAPGMLRDVTLRDGLQDEDPIATADKVALFEALVVAGVRDVELTSFVRPDRVPAMADAPELAAATTGRDDVDRSALVLNARGVDRALESGLRHLQFVISVSDTHGRHNAGRTLDEGVDELCSLAARLPDDARLEVTLATAFGCPYEGPIAPARVERAVDAVLAADPVAISLADTIGVAVPREVSALVASVVGRADGRPVGAHLHDTRGLGVANALAALDAGAARLDASLGGLGGCPFAPGASGNVAIEDLAHVLEESGVRTGLDVDALVTAAHLACELVGRPVGSHVGLAGRRFRQLAAAPGS